jgi:Protein of unknown function (DUF2811)
VRGGKGRHLYYLPWILEVSHCVAPYQSKKNIYLGAFNQPMNSNVSILTDIPEELHFSLKSYLETHPHWDQDRVFAAALSLFLLQNNNSSQSIEPDQSHRACAKVYLEALFQSN